MDSSCMNEKLIRSIENKTPSEIEKEYHVSNFAYLAGYTPEFIELFNTNDLLYISNNYSLKKWKYLRKEFVYRAELHSRNGLKQHWESVFNQIENITIIKVTHYVNADDGICTEIILTVPKRFKILC